MPPFSKATYSEIIFLLAEVTLTTSLLSLSMFYLLFEDIYFITKFSGQPFLKIYVRKDNSVCSLV